MDGMETPTVEDMLSAFGIEPAEDTPTEDQTDEPEVQQSEEPQEETPTDNELGNDEAEQEYAPENPTQQPRQATKAEVSKQNQAFARMRSENAQLQKTLQQIADLLGLDSKAPLDRLIPQVQVQTRNALAKKNGMDPEIMARLDALESEHQELERIRSEQRIKYSIEHIQKNFGATDDDLKAFVGTLIEEGYDATNPNNDLVSEFVKRNWGTIMDRKVKEAVSNEQKRSANGSGASKPDTKKGQEKDTEAHDINTVHDLEDFFRDNL